MADPVTEVVQCLNPDAPIAELTKASLGLKDILTAFFKVVPSLILPDFATDLAIKGPQAIIDLFLKNMGGGIPSFSSPINLLGVDLSITFEGVDIENPEPPAPPIFDPSGLVDFIVSLMKTSVGIPLLFFDIDFEKGLALPKLPPPLPTKSDLLKLIGFDFIDTSLPGFETIPEDLAECILTSLAGVVGIK